MGRAISVPNVINRLGFILAAGAQRFGQNDDSDGDRGNCGHRGSTFARSVEPRHERSVSFPAKDSQNGQSLIAQPIRVALASAGNFDDLFRN